MLDNKESCTYLISGRDYKFQTWGEAFPKKIKLRKLLTGESWSKFFKKYDFRKIEDDLKLLVDKHPDRLILPHPSLVFNAFNQVPFKDIKVVFLGQDPYKNVYKFNGKYVPEATGLSFSIPEFLPIPSSLKNIHKNMLEFGHIYKMPKNGSLLSWSLQGCLMLNSALTLNEGVSNSHKDYWTEFTDSIIKHISNKLSNVVFVLWGAWAAKKQVLIDSKKHYVLISSHPSGFSYATPLGSYPAFKDFDHFGEINKYLVKHKKEPIRWLLL